MKMMLNNWRWQKNLQKKLKDSKFKDQCDVCKSFDYCKGHNGKVLCRKCLQEVTEINKKVKIKQLSLQF